MPAYSLTSVDFLTKERHAAEERAELDERRLILKSSELYTKRIEKELRARDRADKLVAAQKRRELREAARLIQEENRRQRELRKVERQRRREELIAAKSSVFQYSSELSPEPATSDRGACASSRRGRGRLFHPRPVISDEQYQRSLSNELQSLLECKTRFQASSTRSYSPEQLQELRIKYSEFSIKWERTQQERKAQQILARRQKISARRQTV